MSEIERLAERLMQEESGYRPGPYAWLNRPPRLSDMWPCDQEKFKRMAENLMRDYQMLRRP